LRWAKLTRHECAGLEQLNPGHGNSNADTIEQPEQHCDRWQRDAQLEFRRYNRLHGFGRLERTAAHQRFAIHGAAHAEHQLLSDVLRFCGFRDPEYDD